MRASGAATADGLDEEAERLQDFRASAAGRLRLLRRRAALALMGLTPEAGESEVGRVYKRMALELHPDKGGDPTRFQALQEAKELLTDNEEEGPRFDAAAQGPRRKKRRKGAKGAEEPRGARGPSDESSRARGAQLCPAKQQGQSGVNLGRCCCDVRGGGN